MPNYIQGVQICNISYPNKLVQGYLEDSFNMLCSVRNDIAKLPA